MSRRRKMRLPMVHPWWFVRWAEKCSPGPHDPDFGWWVSLACDVLACALMSGRHRARGELRAARHYHQRARAAADRAWFDFPGK